MGGSHMNQKRENMGEGTTLGVDTDFFFFKLGGMRNYLIVSAKVLSWLSF